MTDQNSSMRTVGFFPELGEADAGAQTLAASIGGVNWRTAEAIADYLDRGLPVLDVMGPSLDPLDGRTQIEGGQSLISDGVWVWRADLSYFLRKYAVQVSPDFIFHALQANPLPEPHTTLSKMDEILKVSGWRE